MPSEPILISKDRSGQTFFYVAYMKGYFNIVEYLLKENKRNKFLFNKTIVATQFYTPLPLIDIQALLAFYASTEPTPKSKTTQT